MRVVVTRPQRSGEKTAALLRQRGHEPVVLPLTHPVYKSEPISEAFKQPPVALAVTSAEALRALQTSRLNLADHFQRPLFAVGEATASVARDMGFQNVLIGSSDGHALAGLVAKTSTAKSGFGGRLLYLAGTPREGGFEAALVSTDIELEVAEIYEMQPVAWEKVAIEALLQTPADAVLLYSRETARIFFDLITALDLDTFLRRSTFICMSEKVLSAVPEQFCEKAIVSAAPNEAAMFELLDRVAGT